MVRNCSAREEEKEEDGGEENEWDHGEVENPAARGGGGEFEGHAILDIVHSFKHS